MSAVGLQNHNRFGPLATLNTSSPYESTQVLSQHGRGAPQNPAFVATKLQQSRCDPQPPYNAIPRQNGNYQPNHVHARGPNALPPRFQNRRVQQGFCSPSPRPSSSCPIDPCLTMTNESFLNMQLRREVMMALRSHPPTGPMISPSIPQNLPAQRSVGQELLPRAPETISCPPIGPPGRPNVSVPPPPGVSRPNGGMQQDNRSYTKPINGNGGRHLNRATEKSNFNGLEVESRPVFQAPFTATPHAVKLPANQSTQDTPPSPASTACTLPEDPSGFSSVPSSDTTFTSGSDVSNMPPQNGRMSLVLCRNWMNGYPCRIVPCRFRHPERPSRPADSLTQSTQPPSAPSFDVAKPSVPVRGPINNSIPQKENSPSSSTKTHSPSALPRVVNSVKPSVTVGNSNTIPPKQDTPPPSATVRPPPAPQRVVEVAKPTVDIREPNDKSVPRKQDPTPQPSSAPPRVVEVAKPSVNARESMNNTVPRKQDPPPNTRVQPTSAPPRVDLSKQTASMREPNNNFAYHKQGPPPPSVKTQSPSAPSRAVEVAKPSVGVREPNNNSALRKQNPPPPNPKTQPALAPPRADLSKPSVAVREPNCSSMSRKQVPPQPGANAEPPQRPDPLYATTIADHIKVRFDQGFEVRDVMTGFESRWVHLGNINGSVTSAAMNELLGPYKVDTINMPESSSGKPVTVKVQFASAADAIRAVTDLNGSTLDKRTILAKLAINNSIRGSTVLTDTDVQLAWECPSRVGYAGYDTLKEAKAALDSLNGFPLDYVVVSAQLYEGLPCVGAYNVIFKELPASVTEVDLRKFANSKAVMLGRPNYESLDKAVRSIRSRLEEYGTITAFDVLPPPFKDGMVKAWVHFTSPAEARAAQDDLDRRRPKIIGHTVLSCRHMVSVSHVLSASSYRKMREDIGWLRWSWQRRYGPSVSIRERFKDNGGDDAPAFIRVSSEHPELLSNLKYEFEQLLHGETVTLERKPLWDDFLITEAGCTYIDQVQNQYPGVQIQIQNTRRVISLWGPIVMRHRARKDIVCKLMELKAQQFWKIPLTGKLLGIFCSAELTGLQELLGPENCIPDFGERVLVVRGNDLAFRTACKAVQDAQSRQGDVASSSTAICPVCFGEAVVPVSLACGHRWCRTCLTGYLTSAVENKMFPLRCLGNDATCTQRIPLGLSRKLLSAADFDAVIEAAFWVYVHSRPDEFHNCPTPDCTQVYRSAPPNAVLQCPSCLVRICPTCRIEYHDGLTCEERDVAEDKLFNEWTSNHDVKSCPGCKAPIERSEGCNHMTCTRCQTHICWECLATFPRGQGIYDHMRVRHGGIGL